MRRIRNKNFVLIGLFCLVGGLFGCASDHLKNSENPEIVYNEAVRLIKKGRFLEATEYLNEIRLRFPQSRFYALADLRTGDLYFEQESFTEAAAAYGAFVDLFPTHAEAPYALYQKTLSFYSDAPELAARDQSPAIEAVRSADLLIKRFPSSDFAKQASEIRVKSRLRLAEKEAYIARFYSRRGAHESAQKRWKGLVAEFQDLEVYNEDSRKLLEEARRNSQAEANLNSGG